MAGIYIHIPFCRQACHYCDFHFSTNLSKESEMVQAICQEIDHRSNYVSEKIETVYFGGGTPSILSKEHLNEILAAVKNSFEVSTTSEITLEANPEDLDNAKLRDFRLSEVNRLSIGFQTFSDTKLKWMNRIHSSKEALDSFHNARESGFDNISIDLIYALPNHDLDAWKKDLQVAASLNPEHISIYGLTIEERTVFGKRKRSGELIEEPEEMAADQYLRTIEILESKGYSQYEVSNFTKPGFESKHNSSYWGGAKYLGVGPGAHSYDGRSRQFNVRNNAKYLKAISTSGPYYESEELSKMQIANERILTRLRTSTGIDLDKFESDFEIQLLAKHEELIEQLGKQNLLKIKDQKLYLTSTGFLVADEIALKLFFDE
ncbi:MAG: radical SAM family heme chaperone HemW [Cyclobacteriaceae bacterium]